MARELKVYGAMMQVRAVRRQCRVIVAAHSFAEAARLLGTTASFLKAYGAETGNAVELETALAKPGAVFYNIHNMGSKEYIEQEAL